MSNHLLAASLVAAVVVLPASACSSSDSGLTSSSGSPGRSACDSYAREHQQFALVDPPRPCKASADCNGVDAGTTCSVSYECVVPAGMSAGTCVQGGSSCSKGTCLGSACCSGDFLSMSANPQRYSVCITAGQLGARCLP